MLNDNSLENFKSGFVAILGRPNVGKSTLLNRFLGEKIAIITPKPQTTRSRILGVLHSDRYQIVFVDTPGIHEPVNRLGKVIVGKAYNSIKGSDINLFLLDSGDGLTDEDISIFGTISHRSEAPLIIAVNKIDKFSGIDISEIESGISRIRKPASIISISALEGTNTDRLLEIIIESLPYGPQYYGEDFFTDQTYIETVAEVIREKLIMQLRQEIPYESAVVVEQIEPKFDNEDILHIQANIIVSRPGQKAAIIGKNGKMIRNIGTQARIELEDVFDRKIFLELWVKVRPKWFKNDKLIKEFGLKK